ncbi:hypothetical protein [Rhodoferax bucti]|uniref:hypothetical protein n=1 Tax=Rhodoferax bucti TaxID=2576305 RepID=UPI0011095997|nr:hypothetical protein [Rhodoferax bucti]
MRVVLLILLIALAPLRGMANEWMATRMASTVAASVGAPAHQHAPPAAGHHCEDMADSAMAEHTSTTAAHHSDTTTAASHDGCENCSLCQMCASAALPAELRVALPVLVPQLQAPAHTDRFASAPAALAQKPPIS